ncbi:hypothetical protein BDE02_16G047200 [Populus trichocarpa]|nr:hypothetical protein BDE02_16G047200 [Populus trichocarpa]
MKAFESAIGDTGYIAPEHEEPVTDNTKGDIYAFGVLLLELLTGRRGPFDSSRPRKEQSLVKGASSRLHDNESLIQMVGPGIKNSLLQDPLSVNLQMSSHCAFSLRSSSAHLCLKLFHH